MIAVVSEFSQPFERRSVSWPLTSLPVPADLLVYTHAEWESLLEKSGLFAVTLSRETGWVYYIFSAFRVFRSPLFPIRHCLPSSYKKITIRPSC